MIRLLIAGRRAAGITRDAAHEHLRMVHAPLVIDQPADAGAPLARYVQNHVVDGVYFATAGAHAVERDLVTELCFDSLDAMRAGMASDYHARVLRPDERRFVQDATAAKMMVATQTPAPENDARWKVFAFIGRASDGIDADWRSAATGLADKLADAAGGAGMVEHRVMSSPAGPPFADLVLEAWFHDRDAAAAALAPLAASILAAHPAIDLERSLLLLAEQFDEARLRALGNGAAGTRCSV